MNSERKALDGEFETPFNGFINPNASLQQRVEELEAACTGVLDMMREMAEINARMSEVVLSLSNRIGALEAYFKARHRRELLREITQMNSRDYR